MALPPDERSDRAPAFNGIALCAGVGGLELGLQIAEPSYRTVCYVERDSYAAATLVARMAEARLCEAPVWDDVATFDGAPWRGSVDLVSAGYPCQPFSAAGKRRGTKDPRHLWPHIARIARESRPRWIFLENVLGHIDLGFDVVLRELRRMGYRVEAGLFSACEVGATQWRIRLFILAHADDDDLREPGRNPAFARRRGVRSVRRSNRSADRAIRGSQELHADVDADAIARRGSSEREDLPIFPPGPFDLAAWDAILARRPDIQPCLFRVGDGMAHRLDRHHAIGNGVVPLAAAYAWRTLKAAHARTAPAGARFRRSFPAPTRGRLSARSQPDVGRFA